MNYYCWIIIQYYKSLLTLVVIFLAELETIQEKALKLEHVRYRVRIVANIQYPLAHFPLLFTHKEE